MAGQFRTRLLVFSAVMESHFEASPEEYIDGEIVEQQPCRQ